MLGTKEVNVQGKNWALTSSRILEVSANQSVALARLNASSWLPTKKILTPKEQPFQSDIKPFLALPPLDSAFVISLGLRRVAIGKYFINFKIIYWFKNLLSNFSQFRKFIKTEYYNILLKTF